MAGKYFITFTLFVVLLGGFNLINSQALPEQTLPEKDILSSEVVNYNPIILPDNPLYFLKNFFRTIKTSLTFDPVKKIELELKYLDEKFVEAKLVVKNKKDNINAIEKAVNNYIKSYREIASRLQSLDDNSNNPNIGKLIDKITEKAIIHKELFSDILNNIQNNKRENLNRGIDFAVRNVLNAALKKDSPEKFSERIGKAIKKISLTKKESSGKEGIKIDESIIDILKEFEIESDILENIDVDDKLTGDLDNINNGFDGKHNNKNLEELFVDMAEHILERDKENSIKSIEDAIAAAKSMVSSGSYDSLSDRENLDKLISALNKMIIFVSMESWDEAVSLLDESKLLIMDNGNSDASRKTPVKNNIVCIAVWDPVCGKDGKTYSNECRASASGVSILYKGKCKTD